MTSLQNKKTKPQVNALTIVGTLACVLLMPQMLPAQCLKDRGLDPWAPIS